MSDLNVAQSLEAVFPPAADLYRVLTWWRSQPDGSEAFLQAADEFFGSRSLLPDEADPEHAPELIRFLEWALIDRAEAGASPVARYAEQAGPHEQARLAQLLQSRHDAWRVEALDGASLRLAPLGGGDRLTLEEPALASDVHQNEWIVGRLYPWGGRWMPSLSIFFVPMPTNDEPGAALPLDALMAQRIFFSSQAALDLDPEVAAAELERFLIALQLPTSVPSLKTLASQFETAEGFIGAFGRDIGPGVFEGGAEAAQATRLGVLLANLWYHSPQPSLEGRTPAEVDAEADTAIHDTLDQLFTACEREDEAALMGVLDPDGELALVYDLWGFAGLRMLVDWGGPAPDRELLSLEPDLGALRAEVLWKGPRGDRAATIWLIERPEGFLATEAVAELGEGDLINPAFTAAQDKGLTPAWRAETDDAVERKLRNAITSRKLPMLDQATMLKAWRMVREVAARDASAPEAWAAAVEAFFRASLGQDLTPGQIAEMYGAKKTLVKERFAALNEALNQGSDRQGGRL